jgi:hypothetical protein
VDFHFEEYINGLKLAVILAFEGLKRMQDNLVDRDLQKSPIWFCTKIAYN